MASGRKSYIDHRSASIDRTAHGELRTPRPRKSSPELFAVRDYLLQDPNVPAGLRDEFVSRLARVERAEAGSWDEVFGRPFPPRTRLAVVRRNLTMWFRVHAAVWEVLRENPAQTFSPKFFQRVVDRAQLPMSASTCKNTYYDAIYEGEYLNLSSWKLAMLQRVKSESETVAITSPIPVFAPERLNGFGEADRRT